MPLYEYTCTGCETRFEAFVHTSRAKVECPKCGSKKVDKLLSLFGAKSGGGATSDPSVGGT